MDSTKKKNRGNMIMVGKIVTNNKSRFKIDQYMFARELITSI